MGTVTIDGSQYRTSLGKTTLDPRLVNIIQTAAAASPYNVQLESGVRAYNPKTGTTNHTGGYAIDVKLIDPNTGKAIPNYQDGPSYATYEQFAQTARVVQQQQYPELDNSFRWGGYFSGKPGTYGAADLMHFDVTPGAPTTKGGTWEKGATGTQLGNYPGAKSNGGLGQPAVRSQIEGAVAGHPVPPANVPAASVPATSALSYRGVPLKNVSGSPDERSNPAPIAPVPAFSPSLSTRGAAAPGAALSPTTAANAPYTVSYGTPPPQTDVLKGQIVGAMSHPGADILQPIANGLSGISNWLATPPQASQPSAPASISPINDGQNVAALTAPPQGSVDRIFDSVSPSKPSQTITGTELNPSSIGLPDSINSPVKTTNGIAGTVALPAGVRPNVPSTSLEGIVGPDNGDSWSKLIASLGSSDSAAPAPAASKTVYDQQINPAYLAWANNTKPAALSSPFSNPGVQGLSPDDRQALNDRLTATSHVAATPAPPKYISVPRVVSAPARVATAAPIVVQQPQPVALTKVQQYQSLGLSPSQAYAAAASKALASQPNPYLNNNNSGGGSGQPASLTQQGAHGNFM